MDGADLMAFSARAKAWKNDSTGLVKERKSDNEEKSRERLILASATVTYSSMTLGGSAEQEGART